MCIVLTLLVSSLFYYITFSQMDLKKAYESDLSNLKQTSKEMISMNESAQSLAFQSYRTFTISRLMFYTEPNIYDVTGAMNELSNYLNSMPFIESIYVYNSKNERFYLATRSGEGGVFSRETLVDKNLLNVLDNFQEYRPFTPIPRTFTLQDLNGQKVTNVYTYLGYDAIGKTQKINSAVIINISAAWINKDLGVASAMKAKSYILDDQNRLLSGATLNPSQISDSDKELLEKRIKNQESSYFVANFEGKKSLITFTSPDSLSWQYVRITPYNKVTETISSIRNTSFIIAAVVLIVGLFTSWLVSRYLYRPINQIVNRMNLLENDKRNSSYTIRQNMLRNLIQGTQMHTKVNMDKLAQSGVTFDFHSKYRVVMLKIDQFDQLKETRGADLLAYKFAIMNISWEIGLKHYHVESVDLDDDSVIILLNQLETNELPDADDELLRTVLLQIQQASIDYLRIGISMTYSPDAAHPAQLSILYKEVKEASMHRLFHGRGCLISSEEIMSLRLKEYKFPVDKERKMMDALMSSKTEEAKKVFVDIVQDTAGYPIHVVQLAISHLTMTINNVLFTIYKNNSLDVESGSKFNIPAPDKFETLDELYEVFFSLFDDIQLKLTEKRTMKQGDLIRRINDFIQKEYANPNMSLNFIAEELDMSSIYISRIYKQQTLHAIVDVINNVRLERAKEHLENTDWPIVEIAEKSGYTSSSYFHRMFKKSFGVTPADYRKVKLG